MRQRHRSLLRALNSNLLSNGQLNNNDNSSNSNIRRRHPNCRLPLRRHDFMNKGICLQSKMEDLYHNNQTA